MVSFSSPDNAGTSAAWQYHLATNHSLASVRAGTHRLDWTNQPRPYKLYRDLPGMSLPEPSADSDLPALSAIAASGALPFESQAPALATLTSLLLYSNGITKRLQFSGGVMDFRAAACTGALYHIELYLISGDLPGLEAGVYHFDAQELQLRKLRSGDFRDRLLDSAAGERSLAEASVTVVCTTTYWRNSWKYQARAYRHAFWDSGTVLANLLAMAPAHHLPARLVTGFVDRDVGELLALDPDREVAIALVGLGRETPTVKTDRTPLVTLNPETVPPSVREVDYAAIRHIHAASSLTSAEQVAAWRSAAPRIEQPATTPALLPLAPLAADKLPAAPLEQVIRRRGSARRFEWTSIDYGQLSTALLTATAPIPADYRRDSAVALSMPYLIVRAVDGLEPGAYVYHRERQALELLRQGDFTEIAGHLDLGQELAAQAAVNVYLLADLNAILPALGNRGYRAAQLDAAITAGRLYLAAYAVGLAATGLTFYDDEVVDFFSPHAQGKSVMFLLALGHGARRAG